MGRLKKIKYGYDSAALNLIISTIIRGDAFLSDCVKDGLDKRKANCNVCHRRLSREDFYVCEGMIGKKAFQRIKLKYLCCEFCYQELPKTKHYEVLKNKVIIDNL